MEAVDRGRFVDTGSEEARATPKANADVERDLLLAAYAEIAGKRYAYFQLRIVIPGSEGELRFAYVFSKDAAPGTEPAVGMLPPPPG